MRLIDKDALMQALGITNMDCDKCVWHDKEWSNCKRGGDFEDACCAIENAPTIEPERKKGQWIKKRNSDLLYCSECDLPSMHNWPYCERCGADMRGEQP